MNIKMSLSRDGVDDVISRIQNYQNFLLPEKINLILQSILSRGVIIAKEEIGSLGAIDSGELLNSVQYKIDKNRGYITVGTDHCAFVEFGTGTKGETSPYPAVLPDGVSWSYNTGSTVTEVDGVKGWWINGWFCTGMPSRPYMYNSAQRLKSEIPQILEDMK